MNKVFSNAISGFRHHNNVQYKKNIFILRFAKIYDFKIKF